MSDTIIKRSMFVFVDHQSPSAIDRVNHDFMHTENNLTHTFIFVCRLLCFDTTTTTTMITITTTTTVDDMGSRIDELEKSIGDLMTQAGIQEENQSDEKQK